ncbi:MAG: aspartate carbamoyltransferase [Chlamydiales bacterium]|nr:aspartate carbamoyltransferase [Chlamydiales bacterium]
MSKKKSTQTLENRSLISIADLSKEEIEKLLKSAAQFKKSPPKNLLQGQILASCFFEPSTRTRLSFEAAMLKLGGQVIGFSDASSTSMKKGESLSDSMKIIGGLSDLIVIRHPMEGAARLASQSTTKPVINAGDGANQHPTQTLLDLFSIKECQGRLEGLNVAIVGDLKYGRTVHSLAYAAALFDMRLYFVSPEELTLPETVLQQLRKMRGKFSFHHTIEEVIGKVDILYMTRLQKERFDESVYEKVKESYILKEALLKKAQKHLKVLHPLPRVNEIEISIDKTPYAYYFQQAENGLFVRQALLAHILGKK